MGIGRRWRKGGEVLVVERLSDDKMRVEGGEGVDDDITRALVTVMDLGTPQATAADDATFGTFDSKFPGQSWPINRKLAAQMLGGDPSVMAADVQGVARFTGLSLRRGTEFLTISVVVKIDKYPVPAGFPENMKETQGGRTYTQVETVPDGPDGPAASWASEFDSEYLFEGRASNGATVRVSGTQKISSSCKRELVIGVKTAPGS